MVNMRFVLNMVNWLSVVDEVIHNVRDVHNVCDVQDVQDVHNVRDVHDVYDVHVDGVDEVDRRFVTALSFNCALCSFILSPFKCLYTCKLLIWVQNNVLFLLFILK